MNKKTFTVAVIFLIVTLVWLGVNIFWALSNSNCIFDLVVAVLFVLAGVGMVYNECHKRKRKHLDEVNKYKTENFDPDEFELEMIDYGVDEIFEDEDGVINLYGSFDAYGNIQKYLEENKYDIVSGEFTRIPTDTKELTPEQRAEVDKILDKLDEDDDVTNVYHNIKED